MISSLSCVIYLFLFIYLFVIILQQVQKHTRPALLPLLFVSGVLQRAFRLWNSRRDTAIVARLKLERAVVRHNNRLLSTSFARWRAYVTLSHRKQLLRRQSVCMLEARLAMWHFRRWRTVYSARQRERSHTVSALWHWSAVLQHKVSS